MTLLDDLLDASGAIKALPPQIEAAAANHILDIVGVAAAAARATIGAPWLNYAEKVAFREGHSTLLGIGKASSPAEAALVNGGLMHSLEFDDTHTGAIAHGSAVLASTALAVGEAEGCTGRNVLLAYAIWYEVLIRLGLSAAGGFQKRGFQLTSVGGALCSAGIAATLKGLDRRGIANAIGIALSQASGVFAFLSNGATVKSMHPGWAAHSGIKAADLAQAGLTGPDKPFDDPFGLFRIFADDTSAGHRFADHVADLGQHWHLSDVAFKFLPCCHYIHPFVEAAQKLSSDGLRPDAIFTLRFHVPQGAAAIICDPWASKCRAEGHSARWSLPVAVAIQLVDGKVDVASFEGAPSEGVHDLAKRSSWTPLTASRFPARFDALLEIELYSGGSRTLRIDDVYGNASRPPTEEAIQQKFCSNVSGSMREDHAIEFGYALRHMAERTSVKGLLGGLVRKEAPVEL